MFKEQKIEESASRLEGVDALRGIAIVLVTWYHYGPKLDFLIRFPTGPQAMGWCGVELFFVISGYCISSSLVPRLDEARKRSSGEVFNTLKAFFVKRAFRLMPVCWLWVAFFFSTQAFLNPNVFEGKKIFLSLMGILGSFQNLNLIASGEQTTLGWYWSLSVEEQFYFLFPLFLLFFDSTKKRTTAALTYVFLIALVVRPWCVYSRGLPNWPNIRILSYLKFDSILLGFLAYLLSKEPSFYQSRLSAWLRRPKGVPISLLILGAGLLAVFFCFGFLIPSLFNFLNLLFFSALLVAREEKVNGPLRYCSSFLASVGRRSYIIYLAHMPLERVLERLIPELRSSSPLLFFVLLILTIALATELTYVWIEQPLIRKGKLLSAKQRPNPSRSWVQNLSPN